MLLHLIDTAKKLLKMISRDSLRYKSCGVILTNLSPETSEQDYLFETIYEKSSRKRLMGIIDNIMRGQIQVNYFGFPRGLGNLGT